MYSTLFIFAILIVTIHGQKKCVDFSADPQNCTKFTRCFYNLRVKFTCPLDTAWEDSLKTCVWKEYVEACDSQKQLTGRELAEDEADVYEADQHALDDVPIGKTLEEARALGPIVTPKQYPCSFCGVGVCSVAVTTVQCVCGSVQCPPAPTAAPPRGPCDQNPCLNGGQCISNGAGFLCKCPPNYTGNRCEAPATTACQPNPCLNGGICIPQGSSFLCQCPAGFYGLCCENRITTTTPYNPCTSRPCLNNGQCIPTGTSYLCQCPNGYYGTRCENRNYCIPNPCANNGLCQQTTTGYICKCTPPYTGTNCQQIVTTTPRTTIATHPPCGPSCGCVVMPCPSVVVFNPCQPNPCQNGGACGVQNYGAQCWCSSLYGGYYCQHRFVSRTLTSRVCNKTCLNGGKCYFDEKTGQARCSCSNEYFGSRCEQINRPKSCSPKNPCMNKARCITTKAGSQCVCQKGTSGVLCEKIQRANPKQYCPLNCQAGGTCVYVGSKALCRCPRGRAGRLCELRSGKNLSTNEDDIDTWE